MTGFIVGFLLGAYFGITIAAILVVRKDEQDG